MEDIMYKKYKRIFLIVLDSVGIGGAIDEKEFDEIMNRVRSERA